MPANKKAPSFEKALADLEQLVERLEAGDLSLEESLEAYERGVALSRACQHALDEVEQKIRTLAEQEALAAGEPAAAPAGDAAGPPGDDPGAAPEDVDER